ncbi:LamG-like jellyroll fold domain-containing protein [Bacteroides zhangwenhongii]|uniref:LamG-like jellyroll fold domain-containing protein n=1 Tax=Bacteroides zhangwenhongii TaxID=2650157 RepID=UPI0022E85088|nr:LamG-like jellyroll fold domain-containing protein [Bacteroides zhangwenhongii]
MIHKNIIKRLLASLPHLFMIGALAFITWSCNDTMEQILKEDYPDNSNETYESGHVLLIVMDGASGKAVQQAYNISKTPNLRAMAPHSKYSFNGLADSKKDMVKFTNDRGWANVLTGVTSHGIGTTDEVTGTEKEIDQLYAPSLPVLLKQKNSKLVFSLYASTSSFYDAFKKDIDHAENAGDDNEVTEQVVGELQRSDKVPSDLIIAQFDGIRKAGQEERFYIEQEGEIVATDGVVSAIQTVDGYIGQIMNALKSRPNFAGENWLVIITSNYGGEPMEETEATYYYDYLNRNTFTMMYNEKASTQLLLKPSSETLNYEYYTTVFSNRKYAQILDPTLFNMDTQEQKNSYTLQFMFMTTKVNSSGWWTFVSKGSGAYYPGKGWAVHAQYGNYNIDAGGRYYSNAPVNDGNWHVLTFVFDTEKKKLRIYTDGVMGSENPLPTTLNDVGDPLIIGHMKDSDPINGPFCVSNLQFYNVALPEDFIKKNCGKTRLEELKNEYWDNLLGYWPNDREEDFQKELIYDYSQYGDRNDDSHPNHMHWGNGEREWLTGSSFQQHVNPTPNESFYTAVFNTVDVPYQICQWLGIIVDRNWKLEGQGWPLDYSSMDKD